MAGLVRGKDQWGHRVYRCVVPATKASSFGFAGRTHLVAQRLRGRWRARQLMAEELQKIFGSPRVPLVVDAVEKLAVQDFGNGCPVRMVLPQADALAAFCGVPSSFVPLVAAEVVSDDAVAGFRGAMDLTHRDFQKKAQMR